MEKSRLFNRTLHLHDLGWSIGPSIGPISGGYLLEFASWRVVYVMMVPVSSLGLLLGWFFLPALERPARRQLDYYGLLSVGVAMSTFISALSQGRREGWDVSRHGAWEFTSLAHAVWPCGRMK